MTQHIFTYGSLMFAPVWERVVRRHYRSAAAEAHDHVRFCVAGETYPGMIAQPGARVAGRLYFDVSDDDIAALDAFEGIDYRRDTITVVAEDGAAQRAATYVFIAPHRLSASSWAPDAFELQRFLATYCRDRLG